MRRYWRTAFLLVFPALVRAETVPAPAGPEVNASTPAAEAPLFAVALPVADLRSEPKAVDGAAALKSPYPMDPLEETQLLFGERVRVWEEKGGWVRVEAVEQPEYTHKDAWEGYPGWVLKGALSPVPDGYAPDAVVVERYAPLRDGPSRKAAAVDLPLGARVQVTFRKDAWARVRKPSGGDGWIEGKALRFPADMPATEAARRESILAAARLFDGEPYLWGGRAGHREKDVERPSGVDCSALVNLAYRVSGVDVPRDAHEQYMRSQPLSTPAELKPGDLVFLAYAKKPEKITHVMIYAGGDDVLEAVHEGNIVRQVTVKEKLGRPLKDVSVMTPVGDRLVYFGRLLPE